MHNLRWVMVTLLSTFVLACGGQEVSEPDQAPTQPTDQNVTTPKNPCPDGLEYQGGHCVCPAGADWNGSHCVAPPEPKTLEQCKLENAFIENGNPQPGMANSGWQCGSFGPGNAFQVMVNDDGACAFDGPRWLNRPVPTESEHFAKLSDQQFQFGEYTHTTVVCITSPGG